MANEPTAQHQPQNAAANMKQNKDNTDETKDHTKKQRAPIPISLFLDQWSSCLSAFHQRDVLYRFGQWDDCSRQWKDLTQAVYYSLIDNKSQTAAEFYENSYYHQRITASPTLGVIWEAKEPPGWD